MPLIFCFLQDKFGRTVKEKLRFEETVSAVQERNLSYSETEIETTIQEAIRETRATNRS